MATGYSHSTTFNSGYLTVSPLHKLYYHQYGNPTGKPVIFLHGGPGGGTSAENAAFFNPEIYRVVLLDQRGAGKSRPVAEIRENTTQLLVEDIETLREHLGIEKWFMVFGGSWGSSLSLAYAQTHPERCGSLVLRGIFTLRKQELEHNFKPYGAAMIFPDGYDKWLNHLPAEERINPVASYLKRFCSEDPEVRRPAAQAWNVWEMVASSVKPDIKEIEEKVQDDDWSLQHARIEAHYFANGGFLEEGQLLREENLAKIKHIPCSIVQGRFDFVCPARTAWDLHKALPDSKLYMIPGAGHSAKEPGIFEKLVEICDEYRMKDF